jgi:hypothetical protein
VYISVKKIITGVVKVQNNIIFRSKKQTILRSAAFSFVLNAKKTIGAFYFSLDYVFLWVLCAHCMSFSVSAAKKGVRM